MDRLQQICNELKNENEINIMEEYGNKVKNYTIIIICKIIHVNIYIMKLNKLIIINIKRLNKHDLNIIIFIVILILNIIQIFLECKDNIKNYKEKQIIFLQKE